MLVGTRHPNGEVESVNKVARVPNRAWESDLDGSFVHVKRLVESFIDEHGAANYYEIWTKDRDREANKLITYPYLFDVGTIHTHPSFLFEDRFRNAPPSPEDMMLAKEYVSRLDPPEVRAVYHPRTGIISVYDGDGMIEVIDRDPAWWALF